LVGSLTNPTLAHRCREGAIHPIMAGHVPAIHVLRWWTDKDMDAGSAPAWR
jgi:hypothetical protein